MTRAATTRLKWLRLTAIIGDQVPAGSKISRLSNALSGAAGMRTSDLSIRGDVRLGVDGIHVEQDKRGFRVLDGDRLDARCDRWSTRRARS